MIQFTNKLSRPFAVRYNPYTQSVDILDKPSKVQQFVKQMQGELATLQNALTKLENK